MVTMPLIKRLTDAADDLGVLVMAENEQAKQASDALWVAVDEIEALRFLQGKPEHWQFEVPERAPDEIKALHVLVQMFEGLTSDEIRRTIRWAADHYRVTEGDWLETSR